MDHNKQIKKKKINIAKWIIEILIINSNTKKNSNYKKNYIIWKAITKKYWLNSNKMKNFGKKNASN